MSISSVLDNIADVVVIGSDDSFEFSDERNVHTEQQSNFLPELQRNSTAETRRAQWSGIRKSCSAQDAGKDDTELSADGSTSLTYSRSLNMRRSPSNKLKVTFEDEEEIYQFQNSSTNYSSTPECDPPVQFSLSDGEMDGLSDLESRNTPTASRKYRHIDQRKRYKEPPHDDEYVFGVSYTSKYIGSSRIMRPGSKNEIIAAMRRVRLENKAKRVKKKKVIMIVSVDGVRVKLYKRRRMTAGAVPNDVVLLEDEINRIFYVSHDTQDTKIFSYIAHNPQFNEGIQAPNPFTCHVFKTYRKGHAAMIVHSFGRIFEICHKMLTEPDKLAAKQESSSEEKTSSVELAGDHLVNRTAHTEGDDSVFFSPQVEESVYELPNNTHTTALKEAQDLLNKMSGSSHDIQLLDAQEKGNSMKSMKSSSSLYATLNDAPITSTQQIKLLWLQLEQQERQTHIAISQSEVFRQQIAIETQARNDAEMRCHQLLLHNKDLLEHISRLANENRQMRAKLNQLSDGQSHIVIEPVLESTQTVSPNSGREFHSGKTSPDSGHREMSTNSSASNLQEEYSAISKFNSATHQLHSAVVEPLRTDVLTPTELLSQRLTSTPSTPEPEVLTIKRNGDVTNFFIKDQQDTLKNTESANSPLAFLGELDTESSTDCSSSQYNPTTASSTNQNSPSISSGVVPANHDACDYLSSKTTSTVMGGSLPSTPVMPAKMGRCGPYLLQDLMINRPQQDKVKVVHSSQDNISGHATQSHDRSHDFRSCCDLASRNEPNSQDEFLQLFHTIVGDRFSGTLRRDVTDGVILQNHATLTSQSGSERLTCTADSTAALCTSVITAADKRELSPQSTVKVSKRELSPFCYPLSMQEQLSPALSQDSLEIADFETEFEHQLEELGELDLDLSSALAQGLY